jgi:putative membrane protein
MRLILRGSSRVFRGFLIGLAETVPGVSGGTIALVVGVYGALIGGAARVVRAALGLVRRKSFDSRAELAGVSWVVVIPVLVGMVGGVLGGAAVLEPVLTAFPEESRGVFVGLILASLWIPLRMVGRWTFPLGLAAVGSALLMVFLTGVGSISTLEPRWWVVAPAAAIAICALVLPGLSGSFLLAVMGLYQPTIEAVNDRNVEYLAVFALGALIGLALFVRALQYVLENHRAITLAIMTGLMAGSLRALWPWQGEGRELLGPGENLPGVSLGTIAGVLVVVAVVLVERFWLPRVNRNRLSSE